VAEAPGQGKPPTPKKAQEAKRLLDLGRSSSAEPEVTQLTPGLTPDEAALLREPSRRFGRYTVLGELGRGGMGVVYRAWDATLRRVVALKMAAQTKESGTTRTMGEAVPGANGLVRVDSALMDRLQREAQAASRLAHPNLIRVLDAGVTDGIFYFTMDLVSGICLADLPLPMPEKDALKLIAKVARGVAHAHEQGVLHRDVKPSNIIISERGEPVLIDFGLAKDLAAPAATVTGDIFGTPCYMAPEQATGDPRKIGHKADVYGLGATLYHLVTGRPPYADLEPAQVLLAVLSHPPYPATTLNPMVSPKVDHLVATAMARVPEDRYPDADAFADDIEVCLGIRSDVDPTGRTVVLSEREGRLSTVTSPLPLRVWLPWVWVLGVATALLIGVGLAVWRSDLRHKEPPGASGVVAPPRPQRTTPPGDPGPKPAPPRPPDPITDPPRLTPPGEAESDPSVEARTDVPPSPEEKPPPVAPPADPPEDPDATTPPIDPPADPPVEPPADPDAAYPAEARETLRGAQEALDRALALPLSERASEVRAILGGVAALADQAAAQAPAWPKPKRLRGDALFALGLYAEAIQAYGEYPQIAGTGARPAEGLLAEFLEWFRAARPWAEEVTPTAAKAGQELAARLDEAASAEDLEVSPFLPWRPAAPVDAGDLEGPRGDLAAMAFMSRQDWARARDQARATGAKGGIASYVAEMMGWVAVDWQRPDAVLVEMRDRRVRCAEPWLLASWGDAWGGDFEGAERACARAVEAREIGTPEAAHQIGLIAYRKGDLERAKAEWTAAQGADPTRRVYLLDVGAVCLLKGEFEEADARLKDAVAKKTHTDPPTDRMRSFAEYGVACADTRRIVEVEPRPKKKDRDKLFADAVSRVRWCLAGADKMPSSKDKTATAAPRTYYEWVENNVRHWIRVDPWADGLRADAGTWKQIETLLK